MRSKPRGYFRGVGAALVVGALVALGLTLAGCTLATVQGQGPVPLYLNGPPSRVVNLGQIDASKRRVFNYSPSYDLADILGPGTIPPGTDAITNVRVRVRWTAVDALFNLLTLGFANSMTATVRANAVSIPQPEGD